MRSLGVGGTWVLVAALFVGCGSSGAHAVEGGDGGAGTGGAGGAGGAAGSGAGTGGAGQGADAAAGRDAGMSDGGPATDAAAIDPFTNFVNGAAIAVASMPFSLLGTLDAMYVLPRLPAAPGGMDPVCTSTRTGDCIVSHCMGFNPNVPALSTGYIHVASADGKINVVAGAGSYTGPKALVGDEDLTISTTGGDVPAFSVGLHVPLLLIADQPTKPSLYPQDVAIAAPHTAPLTLTWQRGAPGVFLVAQSTSNQSFGAFGGVNATCFFDSQAGTGTIPAAVLSEMIPGQAFVLLTGNAAVVQAGTLSVKVWILNEVVTPDKKAAVVLDVQ